MVLCFMLDLYMWGYIRRVKYLVGHRVFMPPVDWLFISSVISYRIASRSRNSGNDLIVNN